MTESKAARSTLEVPVTHAKPHINVTPLIDVLLVLLIIFMVVSPLKPARFLTKAASKPDDRVKVPPHPWTLVVTIKSDRTLMINGLADMSSVDDTSKLSMALLDLFQQRLRNHAYRYQLRDRFDLSEEARIEKTVFIKAPRSIRYGDVVRVLDGIKGAGANPVGLQIDDLN